MPDDDHAPISVVLRPIGTPLALGLGAVLLGTTMLSGLQLEWLSGATEQRTVALVGLAGAFPLQIIAAIFALLGRDAVAATGLGIFGSVWAVSGLTLLTAEPGTTNDALGMFLVLGSLALLLLLLGAGKGKVVLGLLIGAGFARLLLSGLYELTAEPALQTAAGIAGLALGAVAGYGVVAILQEDQPQRGFLPVGRSGKAYESLAGDLHDQVGRVENEAGVRRTL